MTSDVTIPTNGSESIVNMICDFIKDLYVSKTNAEMEVASLRKAVRKKNPDIKATDARTVAENIFQMVKATEVAKAAAEKRVEELERELKEEKKEIKRLNRVISELQEATSFVSISVTESNLEWSHLVILRGNDNIYDRFEEEFSIDLRDYNLSRSCEMVSKLVVMSAEKK